MSKQRVIKDEIWDDDWFYDLTTEAKLVWIFLLTNKRMEISGIFKMNLRWGADQVCMDIKEFEKLLETFAEDGKILWEKGWIGIKNFHKHLAYRNPNIVKGLERLYADRPSDLKALEAFESLWITLLNSTLLNLSVGESGDSQDSKKKL